MSAKKDQQRLVIYVPPTEVAQLEAISEAQGGRSVTSIVRQFITEGLGRRSAEEART